MSYSDAVYSCHTVHIQTAGMRLTGQTISALALELANHFPCR
jgi:hypothetical protein